MLASRELLEDVREASVWYAEMMIGWWYDDDRMLVWLWVLVAV